MKRAKYAELLKWKNSPERKPLVVDGARQVGKTWLIREFGKNEYRDMAYVNLEQDELARDIFDGSYEPKRIVARLAVHLSQEIKPGETLIFIDEAQKNPRALTMLKYFAEQAPEYHIVVAGSLLGIAIHQGASFPVGKVDKITIHPLTFAEFLMAYGKEQLAEALQAADFDLISPMHDEIMELFWTYAVVGGMPEVVQTALTDESLVRVREVQMRILHDYERDFSQYADKFTTPKIIEIFNIIPAVLAKENKKFMFGMIKESARAREYEGALLWLIRAGVASRVNRVTRVVLPLKAYMDLGAFKLFTLDIGLLGCQAGVAPEKILVQDDLREFKGALAEQFVAQELVAHRKDNDYSGAIFYYSADDSRAEIDFVLDTGTDLIPIEVKSGKNLGSASLNSLLEANPKMRAVKFSTLPYKDNGQIINMPIYGVGAVRTYFAQKWCE